MCVRAAGARGGVRGANRCQAAGPPGQPQAGFCTRGKSGKITRYLAKVSKIYLIF